MKTVGNFTSQTQQNFPLDCETMETMQENMLLLSALGNIAGDKTILSGCEENDSLYTAGYVFLKTIDYPDGEVLYFEGGDTSNGVYVKIEDVSVTANGILYEKAYSTRSLACGTGGETYLWSDFSLPDSATNAEIAEIQNDITRLSSRLSTVETSQNSFRSELGTLSNHVDEVEGTIENNTSSIETIEKEVSTLESSVNDLVTKVDETTSAMSTLPRVRCFMGQITTQNSNKYIRLVQSNENVGWPPITGDVLYVLLFSNTETCVDERLFISATESSSYSTSERYEVLVPRGGNIVTYLPNFPQTSKDYQLILYFDGARWLIVNSDTIEDLATYSTTYQTIN